MRIIFIGISRFDTLKYTNQNNPFLGCSVF